MFKPFVLYSVCRAAIVLAMLAGCTPVIIDRDFEKEEAEFIKKYGELAKDPLYAPSTESVIKLAEEDGIEITLYKEQPDIYEGMLLDNWVAVLKNKTSENLCVLTLWKLMDFQMETDYADFSYIPANATIYGYAKFKQQIWSLDGTTFALPPSGYIDTLIVKEPNYDKPSSERCLFEDEPYEL